ncbi:MAG: hypothetical protein EBQ96_05985 [Proteobacteria bacterium]|nr:hypothetical protein [Pseudomonadota bacterium]
MSLKTTIAARARKQSPAAIHEWRGHIQRSHPAYSYYIGEFYRERAIALDIRNPAKTSWLARKFYGATTLGGHVRAFKQAKSKADDVLSAAYQKTIETFDPILESEAALLTKSGIDITAAKQAFTHADAKHMKYGEAIGQVQILRSAIENALSECSDATSMEWFDMASNNAGINLLSYLETEEAKEAIEAVTKAIGSFKEYADANPDLFPKNAKEPGEHGIDTGNLYVLTDLAFDGGLLGAIFSYMNIGQLEEASEKLGMVLKAVNDLGRSVHDHHSETADKYKAATDTLNQKRVQGIRQLSTRLGLDKGDMEAVSTLLRQEPVGVRRARQNALANT